MLRVFLLSHKCSLFLRLALTVVCSWNIVIAFLAMILFIVSPLIMHRTKYASDWTVNGITETIYNTFGFRLKTGRFCVCVCVCSLENGKHHIHSHIVHLNSVRYLGREWKMPQPLRNQTETPPDLTAQCPSSVCEQQQRTENYSANYSCLRRIYRLLTLFRI